VDDVRCDPFGNQQYEELPQQSVVCGQPLGDVDSRMRTYLATTILWGAAWQILYSLQISPLDLPAISQYLSGAMA
jgi:hypothetical protein